MASRCASQRRRPVLLCRRDVLLRLVWWSRYLRRRAVGGSVEDDKRNHGVAALLQLRAVPVRPPRENAETARRNLRGLGGCLRRGERRGWQRLGVRIPFLALSRTNGAMAERPHTVLSAAQRVHRCPLRIRWRRVLERREPTVGTAETCHLKEAVSSRRKSTKVADKMTVKEQ